MLKTFIAGMVATVAALVTGPHPARAEDKLALKLDWSMYGPHIPLYLGVVRGLYKAEGIELTINEGNSSGNVVRLVAAGTDPIAFIDMGTMAIGASNGMPVKAVFGIHQQNPMVIISRADAPVSTPKDLENRVIAMAPSESTAQMYPALLSRNSVDAAKISILNPAVGAKNALLLQKRTDAVTGVSYFALPIFERQNLSVTKFAYADYGVPALENGIVVNTDWLEKNKDLVRRFLRASAKTWAIARENPAAAVDEALTIRTDRQRDRDQLLNQLKIGLGLLESPNTHGMPFGKMSEQDWAAMIDVMSASNMIKTKMPISQYYTNEFVPE